MGIWYGLSQILVNLTWMGIAFGIIGYFFYREWNRFQEKIRMMERMTPEQLGDIRRIDAEIEAERKRNSAGNLWFLRLGMVIVGGGIGFLCGMSLFLSCFGNLRHVDGSLIGMGVAKTVAATILGIGIFIFLEFLVELALRRMQERATQKGGQR